IIDGGITTESNVSGVDLVLQHHSSDFVVVQVGQRHSGGDVDTTLVLLSNDNVRGFLVKTDTHTLEFVFNDPLVVHRLVDIEHNEDKVDGTSDGNNLTTTTFTVLGTLNNTGQIKHLNLGTLVFDDTGHGGK